MDVMNNRGVLSRYSAFETIVLHVYGPQLETPPTGALAICIAVKK
jgi:hypothetical protein